MAQPTAQSMTILDYVRDDNGAAVHITRHSRSNFVSQVAEEFSLTEPAREHASDCTYCRRPENNGRISYSTYSHRATSLDYELLLDDGYIRSGRTIYKPSNDKSCCPNLTIRLDALQFDPKTSHIRALRRVVEHLNGSRSIALPEQCTDPFLACIRLAREGRAEEAADVICRYRSSGHGPAAAATAAKALALGMRFSRDGGDGGEGAADDIGQHASRGPADLHAGATMDARMDASGQDVDRSTRKGGAPKSGVDSTGKPAVGTRPGSLPLLHLSRAIADLMGQYSTERAQLSTDGQGLQRFLATMPEDVLSRLCIAVFTRSSLLSEVEAAVRRAQATVLSSDEASAVLEKALSRVAIEQPSSSVRRPGKARPEVSASDMQVEAVQPLQAVCNAAFVLDAALSVKEPQVRRKEQREQASRSIAAVLNSLPPVQPGIRLQADSAPGGFLNLWLQVHASEGTSHAMLLNALTDPTMPSCRDFCAGVQAALADRREVEGSSLANDSTTMPGSAPLSPEQSEAAITALLARIPHELHTGTASTPLEWEAVGRHQRLIQDAREAAGLRLFGAGTKRVWRDDQVLPILDDDSFISDSDSEDEIGADGDTQGRIVPMDTEVGTGTAGAGRAPAAGPTQATTSHLSSSAAQADTSAAIPKPTRRSRAQKLAEAREAWEKARVSEAAGVLLEDIEDSVKALKEMAAQGVGGFAAEQRARAEQWRAKLERSLEFKHAGVAAQAVSGAGTSTAFAPHSSGPPAHSSHAKNSATATAPLLPFGPGPHTLTVTLCQPHYSAEAHELYARFNMSLHRGLPASQTADHYAKHLIITPCVPMPGWRIGQLLGCIDPSVRACSDDLRRSMRDVMVGGPGVSGAATTTAGSTVEATRGVAGEQGTASSSPSPFQGWHALLDHHAAMLGQEGLRPSLECTVLIESRLLDVQAQEQEGAADNAQLWCWMLDLLSNMYGATELVSGSSEAFTAQVSSHAQRLEHRLGKAAYGNLPPEAEGDKHDKKPRAEALRAQEVVIRGYDVACAPPPSANRVASLPPLPSAFQNVLELYLDFAAEDLGVSTATVLLAMYGVAEGLIKEAEAAASAMESYHASVQAVEAENREAMEAWRRRREAAGVSSAGGYSTAAAAGGYPLYMTGESEAAVGDGSGRDSTNGLGAGLATAQDMMMLSDADFEGVPEPPPQPKAIPPMPVPAAYGPSWLSDLELYKKVHTFVQQQKDCLLWVESAALSEIEGMQSLVADHQRRPVAATQPTDGLGLSGGALAPCPIDRFFLRGYTPGSLRLGEAHAPPQATVNTVYPPDERHARSGSAHIIVSGWDLPFGYGSFHQEYRLEGELIALSVLDITPTRVASLYFFYNPDLREALQLGKLSALVEVWLTRAIHAFCDSHPSFVTCLPAPHPSPGPSTSTSQSMDDEEVEDNQEHSASSAAGYLPIMTYLDLNYYVQPCRAMSYKRQFRPTEVQDPLVQHGAYVPLDKRAMQYLDREPYSGLLSPEQVLERLEMTVHRAVRGGRRHRPDIEAGISAAYEYVQEAVAQYRALSEQTGDSKARFEREFALSHQCCAALSSVLCKMDAEARSRAFPRAVLCQLSGGVKLTYPGLSTHSKTFCDWPTSKYVSMIPPSLAERTIVDLHTIANVGWAAIKYAEERKARKDSKQAAREQRRKARAERAAAATSSKDVATEAGENGA